VSPESGHHPEPRHSGHKWFDIAITVCILLISVSSLVVAIVHSETLEKMADANERLVEANSWPFLAYGTGDYPDRINFEVRNDGVGPAKIEAAELTWKGKAYGDPLSFLAACCGLSLNIKDISTSLIAGRVLRAGQNITFLEAPKNKMTPETWARLDKARLSRDFSIDICYCSVFDECWTDDIARMTLRPRRVERCEQPPVPYTVKL
jgi:hypothetical protein